MEQKVFKKAQGAKKLGEKIKNAHIKNKSKEKSLNLVCSKTQKRQPKYRK